MGTAGALSYLTQENMPFLVMNGDLLTSVKFSNLLDFHQKSGSECTMCVRGYEYQLPYGVVELSDHQIVSLKEKPVYKHYVNAGVYVLNPRLTKLIPKIRIIP